MKLQLDKLTVLFPYEHIYPEQYYYMVEVKKALDASGHGVIEMPCGTGKTACLLSVIVAFMLKFPSRIQKLIYCSRTIPEIEKCVEELRHLFNYYERVGGGAPEFLALALSSRKNLCINEAVVTKREGIAVDGACQSLTSSIARARKKVDPDYPHCDFFETWDAKRDYPIPNGIYNLSDLRAFGQKKNVCPYFLSRSAVNKAHIIVYSYHYLLDPKIAEIVSKDLNPRSVVVFDEAHNIDNVCIESMSVSLSRRLITRCETNLESLDKHLKKLKSENSERLKEEYDRLVENLREKQREREEDVTIVNPGVPDEVLQEAIPGTIRTAEHFLRFMTKFAEYVKHRMRTRVVHVESPASFLRDVYSSLLMERKALKFCSERFASLAKTLELADVSNFNPLVKLTAIWWSCAVLLVLLPFVANGQGNNPRFQWAKNPAAQAFLPQPRNMPPPPPPVAQPSPVVAAASRAGSGGEFDLVEADAEPRSAFASDSSSQCWPTENFAMISPRRGCPGEAMETGEIINTLNKRSYVSDPETAAVDVHGRIVTTHYCVNKKNASQAGCDSSASHEFPPGSYCLLMWGWSMYEDNKLITHNCPKGMTFAWMPIDDANWRLLTNNSHSGTVPSGEFFAGSTVLYYCCRDDGDVNTPVVLPTKKPFILQPTGAKKACQQVQGMDVSKEEIFYDVWDDDLNTHSVPVCDGCVAPDYYMDEPNGLWGKGMHFPYCFYKPAGVELPRIILKEKRKEPAPVCWPDGDYGFLATPAGCPNEPIFKTSWISYTFGTGSKIPEQYIKADVKDSHVALGFCTRQTASEVDHPSSCTAEQKAKWEPGAYCFLQSTIPYIFEKGCPDSFAWSFLAIDSTNEQGKVMDKNGTVPAGEFYDNLQLMYMCCRDDGDIHEPINLPTTQPFILFPNELERKCQQVNGMRASLREFYLDTGDGMSDIPTPPTKLTLAYKVDHPKNNWGKGLHVKFCHYSPA